MAIRVRYFASLRETMGRSEENIDASQISTISDVWKSVCGDKPLPDRMLCALNMDYVTPESAVKDQDEVAFFPPITGG